MIASMAIDKVETASKLTLGVWNLILSENENTKSFNKKDALIKLNFNNLPVVGETKLKKQLKALVFSFHLRGRAAL